MIEADPLVLKLEQIQQARGMTNRAFARVLGIDQTIWCRLRSGGIKRASRRVADLAFVAFPEVLGPHLRELQISSVSAANAQDTAEKVPA